MIKLLDFYAEWCGPCKVMTPIFAEIEKDFAGKVEFQVIDVDQDMQTSSKYGVLSIPTYVILKDDKEVDRKIGAMPKEVLTNWLNSHLN